MNHVFRLFSKDQVRLFYRSSLAVLLFVSMVLQGVLIPGVSDKKVLAETATEDVQAYGITRVTVPPFKFYETDDAVKGEYHEYGTGIEYDFAIPEGAQAGDYFTLSIPPELTIYQRPMYKDNETVPYDQLDTLPENRYQKEMDRYGIGSLKFYGPQNENGNIVWKHGQPGIDKSLQPIKAVKFKNAFSTIKDKEGRPVLKMYYTKKGEMTFVVQKAAEGRTIKGRGVIGYQNTNNILAYTDDKGRFYKPGRKLETSNQNFQQAIDNSISSRKNYLGILPNRELLTTDKGAVRDQSNIYTHRKEVSFTTKWHSKQIGYEQPFPARTYNTDVKINYQTELFKYTRVYDYETNLGNETLFPIEYDGEYITYMMVYGAKKFTYPTTGYQNNGADYVRIGGILDMSVPGGQTIPIAFANRTKKQRGHDKAGASIDANSIQFFEGYSGARANDAPFSTVPVGLREIPRGSAEYNKQISTPKFTSSVGTMNRDWIDGARGYLPPEWDRDEHGNPDPPDVWRRRPDSALSNGIREEITVLDFNPSDRTKTYVIKFKARIKATVVAEDKELSDYMSMFAKGTTSTRAYAYTSRPANGFGFVTEESHTPENIIEHPGLRIKKLDHRNQQVFRNPNSAHPSAVIFRATDLETGFIFQSEIGDDGYITFPALIRGHQYKLEEYFADPAIFEKSNMLYKVIVNDDGTLTIEPYSEGGSPLPPRVTSSSFPLASTDDPLIVNFKNKKNISVRLKKVDEHGQLIASSPAVFELHRPSEYDERVENGSTIITPKQGKTPLEIRTERNGRFGLSGLIDLEPNGNMPYALVEKLPPEASKVLREPIKFMVSDDLSIVFTTPQANRVSLEPDVVDEEGNTATNIVVTNNRTTHLIIRKFAEDGRSPLGGAVFKLTRIPEAGSTQANYLKEETTPSNNGEIIFTELEPGRYYLEEKKAPEGYERHVNGWDVVVANNLKLSITPRPAPTGTTRSASNNALAHTAFRAAGDDAPPAPMPTVWHQNAANKRQSFRVNHSDYTVDQNIEPVPGEQGRYKVTVTLGGKNQGLDLAFLSHNAAWSPKELELYINEIASEVAAFLREKAEEKNVDVRVSVLVSDRNNRDQTHIVPLKPISEIGQADWQKLIVTEQQRNFGINFPLHLQRAGENLPNNASANVRRVLLHTLRRSLFKTGGGTWLEKQNIENNANAIQKALVGIRHYVSWLHTYPNGHGPDRSLNSNGRYNEEGRALIRNQIDPASGDGKIYVNNRKFINYYKQVLTEELKTLGKGEMNLALSDAVVFDGFDDAANRPAVSNGYLFSSENNNLKIGKIAFPEGRSQTFSFYVRSNPNTELNVFKNIYRSAKYQVVKNDENNDATRENDLSSPQVLMPGIVPRVTKNFDASVPNALRKETDTLLKRGREVNNLQDPLTFKEGSRNFNLVPKFDERGRDISYHISLANVPAEYRVTLQPTDGLVSGNNGTVTATLSMMPLTIKATKEWRTNSRETQPYDLDLRLKVYIDGNEITDEATLRALGIPNVTWVTQGQRIQKTDTGANLTKTFDNLPRYRAQDGAKIHYVIEEYRPGNQSVPTGANYYRTDYIYGNDPANHLNEVVTVRSEQFYIHEVTNRRSNVKFRIQKVDWENNERLINAQNYPADAVHYPNRNVNTRFLLLKENNGRRESIQDTGAFIAQFELTNENRGFEKGTYYLREERAPDGFWKLSRDIKIVLAEDGSVTAEVERKTGETGTLPYLDYVSVAKADGWLTIKVKNKPLYFDLEVDKKNELNQPLSGANFKLYSAATGTNGETSPYNTFENGSRFGFNSFRGERIKPGTYYLEERAPTGYVGLSQRLAVQITPQGEIRFPNGNPNGVEAQLITDYEWGPEKPNNDVKGLVRLTVVNQPRKYPFTLKKVDLNGDARLNDGNTQANNEVIYDFYRAEGENFEEDEAHKLESFTFEHEKTYNEGYRAGTYYLKERQAPENYHRLSKPIKVVIGTNGNVALSVSDASYNNYVKVTQANGQTPAILTLRNQKILYDLEVKKVKEDNTPINGSYFRLYKAETGNTGEMSPYGAANPVDNRSDYLFNTNVSPGVYYLEEVKSPAGYQKLKKRVRIHLKGDGTVEISDKQDGLIVFFGTDRIANDQDALTNETGVNKDYEWGAEATDRNKRHGKIFVALKVVNKPQNTTIKLHKVDFSHPPKNLTGAKFKVYGPDNIDTVFLNETAVSDQGNNIGELTISNLEKGRRYWIEETLAPTNYLKFPAKVEITIGENGVPTLVNPDPNRAWTFRALPNGTTYNENSEYHLQVKNRKLAFDVIKEGGTDPDAQTLTSLNVRFNLYKATQARANGPLTIDKNQRLSTKKKTLDSDTKISFTENDGIDLYGYYALSEDETDYPQGYKRYTEDIYFKLDQNGISLVDANNGNALANNRIENEWVRITPLAAENNNDLPKFKIFNPLVKKLKLKKISSQANDVLLSGAEFKLYKLTDEDNNVLPEDEAEREKRLLQTKVSGQDTDLGKVVFEDLLKGKYIVKETTPPENYKLRDKSYFFEVNAEGRFVFDVRPDSPTALDEYFTLPQPRPDSDSDLAGSEIELSFKNDPDNSDAFKILKVDADQREGQDVLIGKQTGGPDNSSARFVLSETLNGEAVKFDRQVNGQNKKVGMQGDLVDGTLTLGSMPAGTYYLREDRPPVGYLPLSGLIKVEHRNEVTSFSYMDGKTQDSKIIPLYQVSLRTKEVTQLEKPADMDAKVFANYQKIFSVEREGDSTLYNVKVRNKKLKAVLKVYKKDINDHDLSGAIFAIATKNQGTASPVEDPIAPENQNLYTEIEELESNAVIPSAVGEADNAEAAHVFQGKDGNGYGEGLYYLIEKVAPKGSYVRIKRAIPFYVNRDGTITLPALLDAADSSQVQMDAATGRARRDETLLPSLLGEPTVKADYLHAYGPDPSQASNAQVLTEVVIKNRSAELPYTGGRGVLDYILLGGGLCLLACLGLVNQKKKETVS